MSKEKLYAILGIQKNADDKEIKKAYRDLAKAHHPDKGGDEEKFKTIQRAYDVLSDEKAKEFYDATGEIPGENGTPGTDHMNGHPFGFGGGFGGAGINMADLFGGMFGGGGGNRNNNNKQSGKAPPRVEKLPLSLQQLYNGTGFGIQLNHERFCTTCSGNGSKFVQTCNRCNGSGTCVQHIQIGPNMIVQANGPCGECQGKGKKKGDDCTDCEGKGLLRKTKNIHVSIQPGMTAGDDIVFDGESSESHEWEKAGDLHIIIENAEDPHKWTRQGNNLHKDITISLAESLCGAVIKIMGHPLSPDGILVDIPTGILHLGEIVVVHKGMPFKNQINKFGNMVLKVHITISKDEQHILDTKNDELKALFEYTKQPLGENGWIATK